MSVFLLQIVLLIKFSHVTSTLLCCYLCLHWLQNITRKYNSYSMLQKSALKPCYHEPLTTREYNVTMATYLWLISQWHEVYCHDLEVVSSNNSRVELRVRSTSVPSRIWTNNITSNIYGQIIVLWLWSILFTTLTIKFIVTPQCDLPTIDKSTAGEMTEVCNGSILGSRLAWHEEWFLICSLNNGPKFCSSGLGKVFHHTEV